MKIRRKTWRIATVLMGLSLAALAILTPLSAPGPTQQTLAAAGAILSLAFICWLLFLYVDWKRH